MAAIPRPIIANPPAAYEAEAIGRILSTIETRLKNLELAVATGYLITNPPTPAVRSLDGTSATLTDIRRFVATLTADLKLRGVLG